MEGLVIGKVYTIKHRRKGTFVAQVTKDNGEFIDVEILIGEAQYISVFNENATPGETITIRKSLCTIS